MDNSEINNTVDSYKMEKKELIALNAKLRQKNETLQNERDRFEMLCRESDEINEERIDAIEKLEKHISLLEDTIVVKDIIIKNKDMEIKELKNEISYCSENDEKECMPWYRRFLSVFQ